MSALWAKAQRCWNLWRAVQACQRGDTWVRRGVSHALAGRRRLARYCYAKACEYYARAEELR